ncbi:MAG: amylo-alpha-1,6-glucosidase [Thermoplasmata archaeon]
MNFDEEWIISNRNGSYASSSTSLSNLRTYHGMYVKNMNASFDRYVLLSKLFEELEFENKKINLDTNHYPGVIYPEGYRYLQNFDSSQIPTFYYDLEETKLVKKIIIDPEKDIVMINYKFSGKLPEHFRLYPMLAFRNYHNTMRQNGRKFEYEEEHGAYKFFSDDLFLRIARIGTFKEDKLWYYNFQYIIDRERGCNYEEDLYLPGHIELENIGDTVTVSIYTDEAPDFSFEEVEKRYLSSLSSIRLKNENIRKLVRDSTYFLTRDNILAGYYWFAPWARDTFISLPGLVLIPKRYHLAKDILVNYTQKIKDGLMPKTLSESDNYSTADSSLWYLYALYKYYKYTQDLRMIKFAYPKMLEIIDSYMKGNEYLEMTDDYLIKVKKPQLTWMDARIGDVIFTPRTGFPVEINALWYNALEIVRFMAKKQKVEYPQYLDLMIPEVREKFKAKFVKNEMILDVAEPDDYSIRPNFIFAFSLPYPVLDNFSKYSKLVKSKLLTPFGLRTLIKDDKRYIGIYEGDQFHRDSAYHNGSIWPWLAGPYITASTNAGTDPAELLEYFKELYSLPKIPEIFDGDEPHKPRGCIMQAWSYGELIRAFYEDLKR